MANFGSFEYGGATYGGVSDLVVSSVDIIHPKLIRVNFNHDVVVNSDYYNPENYVVTKYRETGTDARPKRILTPYETNNSTEALTTRQAMVEMEPLTIGQGYTIMVQSLLGRDQTVITLTHTHKVSRRTKLQAALRSLPSHFDGRFDSNIGSLLGAIANADDHIGGTEKERI